MTETQLEVGKLIASVEHLSEQLDHLADRLERLEELAHRGRGAMWVLIAAGSVATFLGWAGVKKIISVFGGSS